jgi:hypothetical protein
MCLHTPLYSLISGGEIEENMSTQEQALTVHVLPRLDLTVVRDLNHYKEVVLFVNFVRLMVVQQALLEFMKKNHGMPGAPEGDVEDLWLDAVSAVVEIDLTLDTYAQGPTDATTYDLTQLSSRIGIIADLLFYVRRLPGNFFPDGFALSGELVVRCQQLAAARAAATTPAS